MYKKILIPLDGSKLAEAPLDYAAWLALRMDAEFTLLNVYSGKTAPASNYLKETGEILYLRSHEHKRGQLPPAIKEVSVSGDPATEILKYAKENNIDLIAMSTHGHSGVKHWLWGSIADRVVSHSNKPVWLIKSFETVEKFDYDRRVLVLLDGSELAEQILPFAAYHAGLGGGELILLSVCESPEYFSPPDYHLLAGGYSLNEGDGWLKCVNEETERRKKECRLYLDQIVNSYNSSKIKVRSEYRFGQPFVEIANYLKNNPVSLMAMTTRSRSGLSVWTIGTMAEQILSITNSPILIMRPEEARF